MAGFKYPTSQPKLSIILEDLHVVFLIFTYVLHIILVRRKLANRSVGYERIAKRTMLKIGNHIKAS